MTFLGELLLCTGIFAATLVSGRLICASLGIWPLLRFSLPNAAASILLGTAYWVVCFGWLTYAGLPARLIVYALGVAQGLLCLIAVYRRNLVAFIPRGRVISWLALAAACTLACVIALLPVLRGNGFDPFNDTFFYCAHADWLQIHGFGETSRAFDENERITPLALGFRNSGMRMGASFFLAALEAASGSECALICFPAAMASGMVLIVLSLFLVLRWTLHLPTWLALGTCMAFSLLPHPLYWAAHNGFLAQTYGLSALFFIVALLSRSMSPRTWHWANAVLIAIGSAFLISVYSEMTPFLLLIGVASLRFGLRRHVFVQYLKFVAMILFLVVLIANIELKRASRSLPAQMKETVGWNIPLTPAEFTELAMGTRIYNYNEADRLSALRTQLTYAFLGLGIIGLMTAWRQTRAYYVVVLAAILLLLVTYYAVFATDPFSGKTGHTWNLFKLAQWGYPVVFLFQVSGVNLLRKSGMVIQYLLLALVTLTVVVMSARHWHWSKEVSIQIQRLIHSDTPLVTLRQIKRNMQSLSDGTLYFVDRGVSFDADWGGYASLLAYPRPIAGTSPNAMYLHDSVVGNKQTSPKTVLVDVIPVMWRGSWPGLKTELKSLGGGFHWMPASEPVIVNVTDCNELATGPDGVSFCCASGGAARVHIFSPRERAIELRLSLRSDQAFPNKHGQINIESDFGPQQLATVDAEGDLRLTIKLRLGKTTISMTHIKPPELMDAENASPCVWRVTNLKID